MKNQRFLKALKQEPVDQVPVWFMRQAGRYLPEYQKVRAQAGSFVNLCQTPELACEVTLQPLRRFNFDAAILFADILTIPDAMGLGLQMIKGKGPCFDHPVQSEEAIKNLTLPDPDTDLGYVMETVRLLSHELKEQVPLIGFAGSPWTVATYMVEGQPSKSFSIIKKMLYQNPILLHQLLSKLAQATADYLNGQIAAGAEVVMLFDSWGGVLTPQTYQDFSLHYMKMILEKLPPEVPTILYGKQTHAWLEKTAQTGCTAIGVDWTIDIKAAKDRVGDQVALQGNMDPGVLYAEPEQIKHHVNQILQSVGNKPGFVFNLGQGIMPDIPPEAVKIAVDTVQEFSVNNHE